MSASLPDFYWLKYSEHIDFKLVVHYRCSCGLARRRIQRPTVVVSGRCPRSWRFDILGFPPSVTVRFRWLKVVSAGTFCCAMSPHLSSMPPALGSVFSLPIIMMQVMFHNPVQVFLHKSNAESQFHFQFGRPVFHISANSSEKPCYTLVAALVCGRLPLRSRVRIVRWQTRSRSCTQSVLIICHIIKYCYVLSIGLLAARELRRLLPSYIRWYLSCSMSLCCGLAIVMQSTNTHD